MKKKNDIKKINGKVENFQPTSLDQIWGDTGINKYGTLDLEAYKNSLNDLNMSDLQSHARKLGVFPTDGRENLIKKLVKEFNSFSNSFKMPKQVNQNSTPSKAALKILSEGR